MPPVLYLYTFKPKTTLGTKLQKRIKVVSVGHKDVGYGKMNPKARSHDDLACTIPVHKVRSNPIHGEDKFLVT